MIGSAFIGKHKDKLLIAIFVAAYAAILGLKFWGLLTIPEVLPGNDTIGHFWAFHEFYQALSSGHFWHYSVYWFGGMPLFQFYAPIGFIFMSGVYAALSHFISQFLVFRWYVFLTFAVFPLPFYFFVKSYLGKKAANFSLLLSLLLVFYPPFMNFLGFGAESAVVAGLFDQMLAVDFMLFYLVALKKLIDSDGWNWRWVIWGGVSLALVFLSHTLTSMMAGVLTAVIALFYVKRWFKNKLFHNLAAVVVLGFFLSAFWLVPFVSNLGFTSAERIDAKTFLTSPLNVFAPFNLGDLWHGGLVGFPCVWILAIYLFIAGLVSLVRRREYLFPSLFFILFFAFGLDYFNSIFPSLTLHYYRLLGYDLLIFLAIAASGAVSVFAYLKARRRFWSVLAGLVCLVVLGQYVYLFNMTSGDDNNVPNNDVIPVGQLANINYHWSLTEFPGFRLANQVISDLKSPSLPEAPVRIMPDMSPGSMMDGLSSIHFLSVALPLANDQSSLFGLYAESAWQLPFIFPTTNLVTGDGMLWGRVRDLTFNQYFQGQNLESMVKRLQLFGINYLVTGSSYFDAQAKKISEATLVKDEGQFKLYHLSGAKPLVYGAGHVPGLFVSSGGLDFREFALGWYSVPELLNYPVADWTKGPGDLTQSVADRFSFIAVESNGAPSANLVSKILSLGKPTIFLNEASSSLGLDDPAENVREIDGFQPVALVQYDSVNMSQPNVPGLNALSAFIQKFASLNRYASTVPAVSAFSGEDISFAGSGPVIVDLSYFPYWQCARGCDNVYPVTPGQILVFASGPTDLAYVPGSDTKVGLWLSILGLVGVVGLAYLSIREKRKHRVV